MKIYSRYKDYYDSAVAEHDPTFHYVRNARKVEDAEILKLKFPNNCSYFKNGAFKDFYSFVYIFFCGKIYCGVHNKSWNYGEVGKESYNGKYDFFQKANSFFDLHGKSCHEINLRHKSPIVIYSSDFFYNKVTKRRDTLGVWADCCLDNFEFFKAVDPFQAFQTIETYLRNNLVEEKQPLTISDEYRIKAHGYDKWSFRKDAPPKRKQKK